MAGLLAAALALLAAAAHAGGRVWPKRDIFTLPKGDQMALYRMLQKLQDDAARKFRTLALEEFGYPEEGSARFRQLEMDHCHRHTRIYHEALADAVWHSQRVAAMLLPEYHEHLNATWEAIEEVLGDQFDALRHKLDLVPSGDTWHRHEALERKLDRVRKRNRHIIREAGEPVVEEADVQKTLVWEDGDRPEHYIVDECKVAVAVVLVYRAHITKLGEKFAFAKASAAFWGLVGAAEHVREEPLRYRGRDEL